MARPVALRLLSGVTAAPSEFFQSAPLAPPADWFSDAAADAAPERFTVYPDGSVAGIVAPAGRCLLDGSSECWTVPRPADGRGSTLSGSGRDEYAMANQGRTATADGPTVATGVLAGRGGHARPNAGAGSAGDHYANTAHQQARVRYVWSDLAGGGIGGVVAVGALWPEITERDIAGILASATSIDYRWIQDEQDFRLVGACLVNIGGLPTRYLAALDGPGLTLTDSTSFAQDVPRAFVAALELTENASLVPNDGMVAEAKRGLAWRQEFNRGGTPVGVARARDISNRSNLSGDTVKRMASYFARHEVDKQGQGFNRGEDGYPSAGRIAWALWGGDPGQSWANARLTQSAALQPLSDGNLPSMRTARLCTECPPVTRSAAFTAVTPAGPAWYAEVSYGTAVGAFCDIAQDASGAELWVVHPVVNGMIDEEAKVVVPASEATLTGRRFEYTEAEDSAVLPETVPTEMEDEDDGMGSMMAALPADPAADTADRLTAIETQLSALMAAVTDIQTAMIDSALKDVPAMPVA